MDKFDQTIKNAKQEITPATTFVDTTMGKITNKQVKNRWNVKLWAPVLGSLAVIVIVFAILSSGSNTFSSKTPTSKPSKTTSGSSQTSNSTPAAAGTDNSSLANYLDGVASSINQENTDQNSANQSVNDSQQEITVPTN